MHQSSDTVDATASNYVARLDVSLSNHWLLDIGYQWDGETEETVRAETGFEYRPNADSLFGFGYRKREGVLEQSDLSVLWPVGDRWRLYYVGYSRQSVAAIGVAEANANDLTRWTKLAIAD